MQSLIEFDQQLSARFSTYVGEHFLFAPILKVIGVGLIYVIPIVLLILWFAVSRKVALRAAIAGVFAWEGISKVIANLVDRPRPSMSQIGAKELIFHRPDTSFPSDHSAFLMAIAVTFILMGQRKLGYTIIVMAVLIGIARVGIGVHFPADILAGWLVGLVTALLFHAIRQPLDRYVIEPLIKLARRFKL